MDPKILKKYSDSPKVSMTVSVPKALREAIDKQASGTFPMQSRSVFVTSILMKEIHTKGK